MADFDPTENVEPDVTFVEGSDVGQEAEPLFPGSTPEEYRITRREALLAVDLCTLAYLRGPTAEAQSAQLAEESAKLGLSNTEIIERNGSEAVVGTLSDGRSFIAFRGTETTIVQDPAQMVQDVFTDFTGKIVNLNVGMGVPDNAPPEFQGIVHLGFTQYLENIYGEVNQWLEKQGGGPYVVLGHSLGAAAALLYTFKYWLDTGTKPQRTYLIGSPKGFETFGTLLDDEFDILSILTRQDIVSYVHPIFHSHKGYKLMLGEDGYELITPNMQPLRIPQDTEEQYAYMRKKQQSNTLNTVEELPRFAQFDVDNFDSSFDNARSTASTVLYGLPRATFAAALQYASVSGHLLDTYRAYIEEMPVGITAVDIEPREPKPWNGLMNAGMPGYNTFAEQEKRMRFKYVRSKLDPEPPTTKTGPYAPPPGQHHPGAPKPAPVTAPSKPEQTPAPTQPEETPAPAPGPAPAPTTTTIPKPVASQTSLTGAPLNVPQAILNVLNANSKIAGYVFYTPEQENEFAYNFIGY